MYCSHCGAELSDRAFLCWRCGRAVQPAASVTAAPRPEQTASPGNDAPGGNDWYQPDPAARPQVNYGPEIVPEKKRLSKRTIAIIIAAAIVVVAVAAVLIGVLADGRRAPTTAPSQGYATHQELIQTYCDYFGNADERGMVTLYPQALRDYLAENYDCDDTASFLYDRDDWYDDYGIPVTNWMISDVTEYDTEDYMDIALDLGVPIESAADVEVTMTFEGEDDYWIFDFDLIEIDGEWFLFSVW